MYVLPEFEVPDLDVIQSQPHGEVIGLVLGHLAVLPGLEVRRLHQSPDTLEDRVDELDVEARREESVQSVGEDVALLELKAAVCAAHA